MAITGVKGNRMGILTQSYQFPRDGGNLLIDSTIRVSADRGAPLEFGESDDGGFGFRLGTGFCQEPGAELMNSDRLDDTDRLWGKPVCWVKHTATVVSKRAGVAMFGYPCNLRHPTGWPARCYSLCSANPFAAGPFTKDKSKEGGYTISAGQTLELRYLVAIYDGELMRATVDQVFARVAKEQSR